MITAATALVALTMLQAAPLTGNGPERFAQCVALIDDDAERAYEEGMAWATETHEVGGFRCAAMALVEQGRAAEGAQRLESLATVISPEATGLRAELLAQAGNAYLLARDPGHARSALSNAIVLMQASPEHLPDLLIDRARAYAMERDYRHAEEDLSRAIDLRPNDPLALRLRASARMHQNSFELAEADALAATRLEPENVDGYLVLGHVRESRRTGQVVEEQ